MPTSMDRAVAAFRRWMRETAGPVPWAVQLGPDTWRETASRLELLDRYNQHTKHCKHCSKVSCLFTTQAFQDFVHAHMSCHPDRSLTVLSNGTYLT